MMHNFGRRYGEALTAPAENLAHDTAFLFEILWRMKNKLVTGNPNDHDLSP